MSVQPLWNLDIDEDVSFPALSRMSEADFLAWEQEGVRAEWVDGEVTVMSPANDDHIDLVDWLIAVFRMYVEKQELGRVQSDGRVRLRDLRKIRDPDILFVSQGQIDRLRPTHVEGAPDLIVEVVSPDSAARDYREKYLDYQAAGVREYWIVDPLAERLEVWRLELDDSGKGQYQPIPVTDGRAQSALLPGFFLRTSWLWRYTRPKVIVACRELGVLD